ncbi:MAG TPA: mannose-1-phosphate guanylyltransferase [Saprospiraceae bacterium]|nr:mannose-1-phosphate guanylyltransferase [Saprospiraceae bacterium]HMV22696.1 mannose-1-phosphate guanylyltransferase [Saprospiraceae bacterium]HMX82132.1 mannose-1-phosphate guanylyltransferase [Saprospiraceae bacterium]HMX84972.1 mannose-1-phosphate guanylyltransferase [Saprospiraceae bacterium]HMZ72603.1 mannose-1-phosphate guanylyltransferase [Saprospiraceae bacterium]
MAVKPYIVIMAGGIGSRFWPASRESMPKQFLDILGLGRSLIQLTYDRFASWIPAQQIMVLTHADYKNLVIKQLPDLPVHNIICEPARRNTAPCIAYGAFRISKKDPDAVMVVVPSDHLILKEEAFRIALNMATNFAAANDALLTLSIKPTRPDTGYGYIQFAEPNDAGVCPVLNFTEKPPIEKAKAFLAEGNYAWNAGIFIWSVSSVLKAFMHFAPSIYKLFERALPHYFTESEESYMQHHYQQADNISVDYAIMESADNVFTIPADIGWSDLGTWTSLFEESSHDKNQNACNTTLLLAKDSSENMIRGQNGKLMVIGGLENFIIIDEKDVLLIWPKDDEQSIKEVTKQAAEKFRGIFN